MIESLKSMFQTHARTKRFNVWQSLTDCKLKEGDPLSPHMIKMIGYVQALDWLGFPLGDELSTDAILGSLPTSYGTFISNYLMHIMDKKLTKLHGMLKVAEQDIKKGTHQVLMVQKLAKFKKSWSKRKAKGTEKVVSAAEPKSGPNSKTICFHCKEAGHWKRNCSKWLAEHGKKAGSMTSSKDRSVAALSKSLKPSPSEARSAGESTQPWSPAAQATCGTGTLKSTASPSTSPSRAPPLARRCSSSTASRSSGSPGATRWPLSPPAASAPSPPTCAATATPTPPQTPPPTPYSTSSATWSRSSTNSASPRWWWWGTTGARWWLGTSACSGRTGCAPSSRWGSRSSPAPLVRWRRCSPRAAMGSTSRSSGCRDPCSSPCLQEPGRAEKAFARYDVATVLKKFYSIELDDLAAPPGVEIIDFFEASSSPLPWMSEEELGQYAEKFQKSGFTGPLNYYRNMDMNWRLTAPWHGAKIMVPAKFIGGEKDIGVESFGVKRYIESGGSNVPDLEVSIIEGHHFLQQEQAERVNSEILSFLDKFSDEEAHN